MVHQPVRFFGGRLATLAIAITMPVIARAQDSSATAAPPAANECLRFAFGAWSTPLDWRAAGHRDPSLAPDSTAAQRENATRNSLDRPGDILLFPPWWPVGVYIELDTTRSRGDTIRGVATALVANGQAKVPTAKVMALRSPCRHSSTSP